LVARSSDEEWKLPTGPYNTPEPKQLKNVGKHRLVDIWTDAMYAHIQNILHIHGVEWNSIDILRIGYEGQNKPVILWIGVVPGSLSEADGTTHPAAGKVVVACKQYLESLEVSDVHCEIKEADLYRSAGPALIKPSEDTTTLVDVAVALTPTLGTCISAKGQESEGTFGFYVTFPEHPVKVFGVTCRHVLFGLVAHENMIYKYNKPSQRRHLVTLPGDRYMNHLKERIDKQVGIQKQILQTGEQTLARLTGQDHGAIKARKRAQERINNAKEAIEDFDQLAHELNNAWKTPENRVIGHVIFSPPIGVGEWPDKFTIDWCMYEVDLSKMENFSGNVIELGDDVTHKLSEALNPNDQNPPSFSYPSDRQWPIKNICVTREEMRHPQTFDKENNPALSVLKRGKTTGVTCGVTNEIESYVRQYFQEGYPFTSKELAVLGIDGLFIPFSGRGDSGALLVDAQGRMVGMITEGTGSSDRTDVTYVTPMVFLLEDMEKHGWRKPNTNVGPLERK
jgi:hypothetical protein